MFAVINNDSGKYLGTVHSIPKVFKTGSIGYMGSGDVTDIDTGKRYIVNLQLVALGTKPASKDSSNQQTETSKQKRDTK